MIVHFFCFLSFLLVCLFMVLGMESRVLHPPGRHSTPGLRSVRLPNCQRGNSLPSGNVLILSGFRIRRLEAETYAVIDLSKSRRQHPLLTKLFKTIANSPRDPEVVPQKLRKVIPWLGGNLWILVPCELIP